MAKRNNSVAFKGNFELDKMELTEDSKEGIFIYDILRELKNFDGKFISLTIKEEFPVEPKE